MDGLTPEDVAELRVSVRRLADTDPEMKNALRNLHASDGDTRTALDALVTALIDYRQLLPDVDPMVPQGMVFTTLIQPIPRSAVVALLVHAVARLADLRTDMPGGQL